MLPAHTTITPARRAAWLLLVFAVAVRGDGLYQQYCSNQNTGADYQAVSIIYNSNGACQKQCQSEYAFAVVQWQSCWCSNYIPANQDNTASCDQTCPGYPKEFCGNGDNALFGYIPLTVQPSGTMGASSPTQQPASSGQSSPSQPLVSSDPAPQMSSSQPDPETSYISQTVVATVTQQQTVTPPPAPLPVSYSEPSSSESATPVTSVRVVTVSGARVTQTVTSTPYYSPGSDEQQQQQQLQRAGLSGGAIAGIIVGVLVGLAAVLLAAFLLWRRKKNQDDESGTPGSRPPKRTTSVLSRTGLLSRGTRPASMAENNFDEGYMSVRHSMLFGAAGAGSESVSPSSPLGGSQDNVSSARRHSRPMVYDQRLNPSALFANAEANGSRVSVQDAQDYSRPLGIANPDLRSSFESRVSGR